MISYERLIDAFRDNGLNVVEKSNGVASAQGPGHSPADKSVGIRYNATEECTWICSYAGEDTADILDAVGLSMRDLYDKPKGSTYTYPDGRVVNKTPDKKFFQSGNTKGSALYRGERLAAASTVYFCEGEKDVHALEAEGVVATTTAGGAGNVHLADLTPLHGKTVVIVRDMDKAGEGRARKLMELLAPHCAVSVVEPAQGKDAADHVTLGQGVSQFRSTTAFDHIKIAAALKAMADEALTADTASPALVARLRSRFDAVSATTLDDTTLKRFGETLNEWWDWIDAKPGDIRSMRTPWPEIDDALAGGLHPGRLYLIGARPGHGKSIGLTNFAQYAASNGHVGALFSLEMGRMEVMSRIMAAGARAEFGQLTRRSVDDFNRGRLVAYASDVTDMPLFISDRARITIDAIRADALALKRSQGLDFIAVDYLQLLKPVTSKANRQEQIAEISWALKIMSRELEIAVLVACQLNRGNAKDKRPPALSDLRESGSLEQDADVVMLLHHHETEGQRMNGDVDVMIEKNRTGPLHTATLPWRGYQARIG
ncbi:DnaB-like helicase C-terminal domain-containing protein [Rhodococcus sp. MEB064]|uniref:DnaB-like helicase C-terminal domain-containing protein n=1 Tax=Rhodococcus sp. MEB064 TaxID=1587522 RepID=UPI00069794C6|nr:DnaB-like helicase C-terminal domain-containing protein [Rhodococcus sp. MEB064]